MFNILFNLCLCATMILGGNMEVKTMQHYLTTSEQAQVIINNDYYELNNLDDLNTILNEMLNDSYSMPAFGVSIHTETLKSIQKGVWLKLQYNGTQKLDDMHFDELLIEVNPDFYGFNIIRGNKGIYDGRCFYINLLNTNMKPLHDFLVSQTVNN